jgi:SAM-dependent methyltransferase
MSEVIHEPKRLWEEDGVRIIDCVSCGFIHVDPIPTKEELLTFYEQRYYTDVKPFNYKAVTEDYIASVREKVQKNGSYKRIFNQVEKLLPAERPSFLSMLDIGCGNDLLSYYFESQGWHSVAIEPSRDAARYLRNFGLTVHERFADELDQLDLTDLSFVNIQFVLEHIADPTSLLQKVYDAMAPGGVIRICVPNDFSDGQLAYKEYYNEKLRWVVQPDHINYFSFSSLRQLLEKCGFEEVYRTTNFPLEFLLLGGMNYYADEEQQRKVGPFISQFQQAFARTGRWSKLVKLYESLAQLEMGRSVFMFAVKR